ACQMVQKSARSVFLLAGIGACRATLRSRFGWKGWSERSLNANHCATADAVVLDTRNQEGECRGKSQEQMRYLRNQGHDGGCQKQAPGRQIEAAGKYAGFEEEDHARGDGNHRRKC